MENTVEMITLETMSLKDLEDVLEIEELSFSIPWSRESFISELTKNKLSVYIVAKSNNAIVGYAGMWQIIDEGHITNIAVHPEHRRKSIGTKMVEGLIDIAKKNNIAKLTLEVRKSNVLAQELYKKFGFETLGVRKKYYADDNEDALIMWKVVK